MPVRVYTSNAVARSYLQESLHRMLAVVNNTPMTQQQMLRIFKLGICPRLSWPLLVEDFPISWLEVAATGHQSFEEMDRSDQIL